VISRRTLACDFRGLFLRLSQSVTFLMHGLTFIIGLCRLKIDKLVAYCAVQRRQIRAPHDFPHWNSFDCPYYRQSM